MKITFLLTQDISSPSGLGRYFPWAKELVRLGHDVQIITLHPDFQNLPEKTSIRDGVRVAYVAQMHVKKSGNTKTYFSPARLIWVAFQGTIRLTMAAVAKPGDVILIGKPHPMNSVAALIARAFRPRTRIIVDCDDFEAGSNRFQTNWQKNLVAWFENYVPRRAQWITSNTFFNLHRLERAGIPAEKMVYVPNGIDPQRFGEPDADEVKALRTELELTGKKVIAYLGSMSLTNHQVDLLLRAFVIVQRTIPEARLLLVGAGEDLEALKSLAVELGIERKTIFTGRVSPDQVSNYYGLSDVTVDPVDDNDAARGRCPLKMFESWACGVPFVTADVGDRRELSGEPAAVLLVEGGKVESLADGLARVIQDQTLRQSLRQAASEKVHRFHWKSIAEQTHWIFLQARRHGNLSR